MHQLTKTEQDLSDVSLFFSDGYHILRLRMLLVHLEKKVQEGTATKAEADTLIMFQ